MNDKDFLPAGTIVKLRLQDQLYMIVGHLPVNKIGENLLKIRKYCAVKFPFGFEGDEEITLFNDDVIKRVIFNGYKDAEYDKYNERLVRFATTIKKKGEEAENEQIQ